MSMTSLGTLAQSFMSRQHQTQIRTELSTLSRELTTGIKSSARDALSGNTAHLSGINRALTRLESFDIAAKTAQTETEVAGKAVESMRGQVSRLLEGSTNSLNGASGYGPEEVAADARQAFGSMIDSLNVRLGDRSLFSGTKTADRALESGQDILQDITDELEGVTTADGVRQVIAGYFAPDGPFASSGEGGNYLGGDIRGAVQVSSAREVLHDIRASDREFRVALEKVAVLAVAGQVSGQDAAEELVSTALSDLTAANKELIRVEGKLGTMAARAEDALAQNASERATYEEARLDLIAADPFETASRFEERRNQLDSLYAVTARLSRLSFADYLR